VAQERSQLEQRRDDFRGDQLHAKHQRRRRENQGRYDCVVRNAGGAVASRSATLNVNDPPAIVLNPLSQAAIKGNTVTFVVVASGSQPLSYQWRKNGGVLANGGRVSGALTATLTITLVDMTDNGDYDVVVSNWLGQAISNPATLQVYVAPTIIRHPAGQ
jgi:hypothetical protein